VFGSQALETAIGLAVLFFIVATAASAILEVIARLAKKRANDLEKAIKALLTGEAKDEDIPEDVKAMLTEFKNTSVWKSAEEAAGRTLIKRKLIGPSYLSAKSFADAVTEYLGNSPKVKPAGGDLGVPPMLEKRLATLVQEGQTGILSLKSGIESWFDEAMGRAEGAYKRWATMILFLIGFTIAAAGNVSAISTAEELWSNPAARTAIADAAQKIENEQANHPDQPLTNYNSFTDAVDQLDQLGFPVGWDDEARQDWKDAFNPPTGVSRNIWGPLIALAGWLITAALVMLGAPFWFDLLTRLVALRSTGTKPQTAAADSSSATGALAAAARTETGIPRSDSDEFARNVGLVSVGVSSAQRQMQQPPPPTQQHHQKHDQQQVHKKDRHKRRFGRK